MKAEDLSEQQIDRLLNSKVVQKYVAYRSLTDGIEALEEDDGVMYETFLDGVHRRVSRLSRESVDEVIQAMVAEVEDNTAFVESIDDSEQTLMDAAREARE